MADEETKLEPPEKRLKLTDIEENRDDEKPGCSTECEEKRTRNVPDEDESDSMSEISNLSGLSEESWKPTSGAIAWIQKQIMSGVNPRPILKDLIPDDTMLPDDMDDFLMWKIIISIMSEPTPRKKLSHINTFQDVINLLQTCKNIMVLTGAGVSVSCGIPDFRSRDGIYARLAVDFPDLPDPQAMFDINYFRNDQRPFFKFAKEIYPGQFEPSRAHKFISMIEKQGKLLRNYTQNIDTLEQVAGITKVIQCHGSFATATCMACKHKVDAEAVREDIFNQVIPRCPVCPADTPSSIMKPDIVFFGESLSDEFHKQMTSDKDQCDLLIVIGSSLKVRPVALIPNSLPEDIPQILINREPLKHLNFDVELLGDCDTVIEEIHKHLNWDKKSRSPFYQEVLKSELRTPTASELGDNINNSCDKGQGSKGQTDVELATSPQESQESKCPTDKDNTSDQNCSQSQSQDKKGSDVKISASDIGAKSSTPTNENIPQNHQSIEKDKSEENEISSSVLSLSSHDKSSVILKNSTASDDQTNKISDSKNNVASQFVQDQSQSCQGNTETTVDNHEVSDSKNNSALPQNEDKNVDSNSHEDSEDDMDDLEVMRNMWKPRYCSLAKRLGEKQYLFIPPSRYVFSGAEVYSDMEDHSDSNSFSDGSTSDDEVYEENSEAEPEQVNGNHNDNSLPSSDTHQNNGFQKNLDNESISKEPLDCSLVLVQPSSDCIVKTPLVNGGMHQSFEDCNKSHPLGTYQKCIPVMSQDNDHSVKGGHTELIPSSINGSTHQNIDIDNLIGENDKSVQNGIPGELSDLKDNTCI